MSRYLLYNYSEKSNILVDTHNNYNFSELSKDDSFYQKITNDIEIISVAQLYVVPLYMTKRDYTAIRTEKVDNTGLIYYKMLSNNISNNLILRTYSSNENDFIYFCEIDSELVILTSCDRIFFSKEFGELFRNKSYKELDLSMYIVHPDFCDFSYFFKDCINLKSLNLRNINFKLVKYFNYSFDGCTSLERIDFNKGEIFPFSMFGTFSNCRSLKNLSIKHFNFKNTVSISNAFGNTSINSLYIQNLNPNIELSSMCYRSKIRKITLLLSEDSIQDYMNICHNAFFMCENLAEINTNIKRFYGNNVFEGTKLKYKSTNISDLCIYELE